MNTHHPITPPPELVDKWEEEWHHSHFKHGDVDLSPYIATQATRWGADQELEACCEVLARELICDGKHVATDLCMIRRPKPPSLKEQALKQLRDMDQAGALDCNTDKIRAALEATND